METQLDTQCGCPSSPGSQCGAEQGHLPERAPLSDSHKAAYGPGVVRNQAPWLQDLHTSTCPSRGAVSLVRAGRLDSSVHSQGALSMLGVLSLLQTGGRLSALPSPSPGAVSTGKRKKENTGENREKAEPRSRSLILSLREGKVPGTRWLPSSSFICIKSHNLPRSSEHLPILSLPGHAQQVRNGAFSSSRTQ